ncbi:hypothetical protein [Acinetobacter sp. WCHAc060025]|uniref:hypothetical protein n=1 Tax=Acinetobacter sp. WCHAc060025 TaxID=2518625 RepID=UPI00102324EA|nr:hypothetical protein [Acinetobacter sp. WCHAc060025]RZG72447.1 hypothetical protein EXE09_17155 [Acinetobacter sp. WCHAc060025]
MKLLDLAKKNLEEYISIVDVISILAKTQNTPIRYVGTFLLSQKFEEDIATYFCDKFYVIHDNDEYNWGKFTDTNQFLLEISENEELEEAFTFHEKNISTLLSSSYWKLSDLYNLKLFRELSIDFYFRIKKILDLIKNKKLPIEKFENIDELTIDEVKELLGEDHRTYIKNDQENFIISAFVESLQRCFNYFDINSNFDMVIEKKLLKSILSENGIIIDGFNNDLDAQVQNNNVWDKNYLLQLEQECSLVIADHIDELEFSDDIYLKDSLSEENQKQDEYPLYYKNCTFTVQEVACLLSGYTPISVDGKWDYVPWLKENPKFQEALDFVWSAVRGNIFDEIYADYFVIESEKLKDFLATREKFIDGFNKHLEPLEKDRMPETNNLILDRLEQQIEGLNIQLLEKDKIIKKLKESQAYQDIHPSLAPDNPNHAPELLIAIEVWEEKYQNNAYPHMEHTPAITNILKKKGLTQTNLVKRICAITNTKSNKSNR